MNIQQLQSSDYHMSVLVPPTVLWIQIIVGLPFFSPSTTEYYTLNIYYLGFIDYFYFEYFYIPRLQPRKPPPQIRL